MKMKGGVFLLRAPLPCTWTLFMLLAVAIPMPVVVGRLAVSYAPPDGLVSSFLQLNRSGFGISPASMKRCDRRTLVGQ